MLVLTDDQRFDTLWAMPILQRKVVRHGVRFSNALVTTPLCCPMRASLLSGGYLAQNTGVLANPPFGGDAQFVDADTLPLVLQRSGYRTQLVGKYLNGWEHPHIPRGWTEFSVWGSQRYTLGSSAEEPGTGQYVPYTGFRVDAQRDRVLQFIDQHLPSGHPLFIVFAPAEPHYPAFPAPQDEDLFPDYVFRERAYEPGHWTIGLFNSVEEEDEFHRDQLRSLQSVDRAIGAIVERLKKARQLKRTVFVFASDNGYLWGEHGEFTKKSPWEESIRVPLVVMAPGVRRRTDKNLVAVNLDVPATFLDFAGLPAMGDGASLRELLKDRRAPWREEILIEHFGRTWAGLRTRDRSRREWKYVERVDGDPQLFDLVADPYELTNLASLPEYQPIVQDFAARLAPQKGVASLHYAASVPVRFGNPFALEIGAWGGRPPFTWRILSGHLPLGLSLDEGTGTISGVALEIAANVRIEYELTGSRVLPQAGRLERYRNAIEFDVLTWDFDHDGTRDAVDNCPFHSNPGQQDTDRDGVGDACFACSDGVDNDGDGRVDFDGGASRNGGVAVTPRDLGCSLQAQRTSEVSAPALLR